MIRIERNRPQEGASPAWAHLIGAVSLGPPPERRQFEPGDRDLIVELDRRYCWADDEQRGDILGSCLTSDVVFEGSVEVAAAIGPMTGREAVLEWHARLWTKQRGQQRHSLHNTIFEQPEDDAAVTLSYLSLHSTRGRRTSLVTTGFYRCEHVRSAEGWKIKRLFAGFDAPFWPRSASWSSDTGEIDQETRRRYGLRAVRA